MGFPYDSTFEALESITELNLAKNEMKALEPKVFQELFKLVTVCV